MQKLSTEEIQVNIIHKGVGAITESDVLLASASDAVIIGFNVRPAGTAGSLADKEEIDIRTYSIIYDAINDIKDAMEGMLSPELKEEITGTAEIRETFKISKVGTIAGCMVTSGKVYRKSNIRIIRDGIVIHTGELTALKRFKDDVQKKFQKAMIVVCKSKTTTTSKLVISLKLIKKLKLRRNFKLDPIAIVISF